MHVLDKMDLLRNNVIALLRDKVFGSNYFFENYKVLKELTARRSPYITYYKVCKADGDHRLLMAEVLRLDWEFDSSNRGVYLSKCDTDRLNTFLLVVRDAMLQLQGIISPHPNIVACHASWIQLPTLYGEECAGYDFEEMKSQLINCAKTALQNLDQRLTPYMKAWLKITKGMSLL